MAVTITPGNGNATITVSNGTASIGVSSGSYTTRSIGMQISGSSAGSVPLETGDSKAVFRIPSELNNMVLTSVGAAVTTASYSGDVSVQVRRVRSGVSQDMLSTPITIDQGETDSATGAAAAVIDTGYDDVQTLDIIHIDINSSGTGVIGLVLNLKFEIV